MEKASKAKSSEKRTVDQDSQVQQRCKIEHPEDERDVQAGVAEVRSKGNADKMSKAGTKEEIRKDVVHIFFCTGVVKLYIFFGLLSPSVRISINLKLKCATN